MLPFFWYDNGRMDFGGDSSRLYFYSPEEWLKNIALYAPNPLTEIPNFFLLPFLSLLVFFKKILIEPWVVASFVKSMVMVVAFLSVAKIIEELSDDEEKKDSIAGMVAGLFFVLSPILIYEWQRAAYYRLQLFVYPLFFLLWIKYAKTSRFKYLIYALLLSVLFSVNFGFGTAPWLMAFVPLAFVSLFAIFWEYRLRLFCACLIFSVLFVSLHAFHLLPQLQPLLNEGDSVRGLIFDESGMHDRGETYFLSIAPSVRIIYNFFNLPQYYLNTVFNSEGAKTIYHFGIEFFALSLIYILTLLAGLFLPQPVRTQKRWRMLFFIFLFTMFLMTANIGGWGIPLYSKLFSIPGFSMFRSFYTKFNLIFVFFYALLFGLSLQTLLKRLRPSIQTLAVCFLVTLIFYNATPLLNGSIINSPLLNDKRLSIALKVPDDLKKTLAMASSLPSDAKFLTLPLTAETYQVFFDTHDGAYIGPSTLALLAGRSDYPGIDGLRKFHPDILKDIEADDHVRLKETFYALNVRYAFMNSDPRIFIHFPNSPFNDILKKTFPNAAIYEFWLQKLSFVKIFESGSYSIWEAEKFLPEIFSSDPETEIKYAKIDSTKYRMTLKTTKDETSVVLSSPFNPDWKLYLSSVKTTDGMFSRAFETFSLAELDGPTAADNKYGNYWTLDIEKICENENVCVNDGGWKSIEFIVENRIQRTFYVGAAISCGGLIFLLAGWGIVIFLKRKI